MPDEKPKRFYQHIDALSGSQIHEGEVVGFTINLQDIDDSLEEKHCVIHREDVPHFPKNYGKRPTGYFGPIDSYNFEIHHQHGVTRVTMLDAADFYDANCQPLDFIAANNEDDDPDHVYVAQNCDTATLGRVVAKLTEWDDNVRPTIDPPARPSPPAPESDDTHFDITIKGTTWHVRYMHNGSGFYHLDVKGRALILNEGTYDEAMDDIFRQMIAESVGGEAGDGIYPEGKEARDGKA